MHRIKRIVIVTAITAITAGSVPAIAAASKNTGPRQLCDAMPGLINMLGQINTVMDPGSAAFTVLHGAQEALFRAAVNNCP